MRGDEAGEASEALLQVEPSYGIHRARGAP